MSGIPSWAVRGAKVVCVDASGIQDASDKLVAKAIYTIDAVHCVSGQVGLGLVEARSVKLMGAYKLQRFRPVVPLETGISTHFRQHLDVREPVEA